MYTLSHIKQEFKKRVSKIYALSTRLFKIWEKCISASNKYFNEVDTFLQEVLLSGLDESGKYLQDALALFYRDIVGIELSDPNLLIRLLNKGKPLKIRINYASRTGIWHPIRCIIDISRKILDYTGREQVAVNIEKPIDFAEGFVDLIYELVSILPQFNEKTFLIWSLAGNVYWYLIKISESKNTLFTGILEIKDFLYNLGVSLIKFWNKSRYSKYSIIGYPDYMKSRCLGNLHPHASLKISLFDFTECHTFGGGLCKLVELSYELLHNISSYPYSKWIENIKDFEYEYVKKLYNKLAKQDLKHTLSIAGFLKLSDIKIPLTDLRKIRHILLVDRARYDGSSTFNRLHVFEYDNNLIVDNMFSIVELLENIAALMFLRLVDFVNIENRKAFLLLSRRYI